VCEAYYTLAVYVLEAVFLHLASAQGCVVPNNVVSVAKQGVFCQYLLMFQ
jgi:hypothetical protein